MQGENQNQANNQAAAQNPNQLPRVSVDAATFGAKYQSKREVFRFLTHDCGAFLGSYESMTIYHMADLVAGRRKRIKQVDVKHITVPFFEGLKIETMLEYAAQYPEVMQALPMVQREREKLPRGYLANVIYTIVGEPFKTWVEQIVDQRHNQRRQEDDQILLDPEIAVAF